MTHAASHPLDHLVWNALTGRQAHLAVGSPRALRFHPDVAPFAALSETSPQAFQELAALLDPDGFAVMPVLAPLPQTMEIDVEPVGVLCQMVAADPPLGDNGGEDVRALVLGEADVPEMLDLTARTKPGPFTRRTREMGRYIGIRDGARLVAMAGERMQVEGYTEISAVCVDETHRGQGLAARLMNQLRRAILARGDVPFLHVFEHNHAALALYEKSGFITRRRFHLYRVTPAAGR